MSASTDLNPKHHKIVSDILYEYAPDRDVLVFGSRAKWSAKDKSDLDLCLMGDEPLPSKTLNALTDALEESPLPFKVDVVEWEKIENGFREIIKRDGVELGWPEFKISDVGEVVTGKTPPTANKYNFGGIIPFITPSDMNGEKHLDTTARHITEKGLQTVKNSYIPAGSIMVSCIGSDMGKVSINRKAGVTNQQINSIVVNDSIESEYVYYVLKPRKNEFLTLATSGSAQPILNKGHFSTLTISVPPRDVQKEIVDILGSLDQKIELNQRMNETLEGMARAIFKSWFVDFDPVHAKAEGREPEGMDSATAALFPSTFTSDGLPEGWKNKKVSEAIELNPTEKLPKGTIAPYLDMAAIQTQGSWPDSPIEREFKSGSKFRNGDTLLARITPCLENGKTAYIDCLEDNQICWGSTEFIVMRPKPPLVSEYAYILARSNEFRDHAIQSMTGTSGRQRVQNDALGNFEICIPCEKVSEAFGEFVRPLFKKIKANSEQNQTLAALRDTLLPKLISGELRVAPDTEKLKEAVGCLI